MSATTALLPLTATWIGIELLAREIGRHGHDPFAWGCSDVAGPLAISAEAGAALP